MTTTQRIELLEGQLNRMPPTAPLRYKVALVVAIENLRKLEAAK